MSDQAPTEQPAAVEVVVSEMPVGVAGSGCATQFEERWVVAYQRRIIAHRLRPKLVAQSAIQLVGDQGHRLVFCAREDRDR